MNEIIKISYEAENPTVLGRELHEALEVGTPYHKWLPRMCEYGFTENIDFVVTVKNVHNSNGGLQTVIDHQLTIPMAKEICMIQRTEKRQTSADSIFYSWKINGIRPKRLWLERYSLLIAN